ncbi:MAG: peroxiredoxin family protein, partial [bacterium]
MKLIKKRIPFAFMIFLVLSIFYGFRACYAQIVAKQTAPVFSLKDLKGEKYNLEKMQDQQMIILYFFDIESRPSQEGLLILNDLAKRYQDTKLIVWAITQTSKEKADDFISRSNLVFPLLLDDSEVINLYQDNPVFPILPKVCTIGPGLKVLDCFQGGGKATEIMLVRVAERELQQRHTQFAKAISDEVVKKNPESLKAKTVKGYAELKEGNLAEAGENFNDVSKMGN